MQQRSVGKTNGSQDGTVLLGRLGGVYIFQKMILFSNTEKESKIKRVSLSD